MPIAPAQRKAKPPHPPLDAPRLKGRPLTNDQRLAVMAARAAGTPSQEIAKALGVHRNTITRVATELRTSEMRAAITEAASWRTKFDALPSLAVDAIERSIKDQVEIHKAAGTAQTHLKGVGIYTSDTSVNVFVGQLASLPEDWQKRGYISNDASETPQDVGVDEHNSSDAL